MGSHGSRLLNRLIIILAALGIALSLSVGSAQAREPYKVSGIRTHALGGCVRNTETHVLACINGYYHFTKRTHGHRKTFYGIRYSAQRCRHGECYGRLVTGKVTTPYRLWAKGLMSASSKSEGSGCGIYAPLCWATSQVQKGEAAVINHVIKPCAFGSAKGFGGVVATNITVQTLFRGGLITAAQFGKYFTGPVGIGIISVATCSVGFVEGGINNAQSLF